MIELKGQKVLVVGLGKTGEALVNFLLKQGARVWVSEKKSASELKINLKEFEKKGVRIETGGHQLQTFLEADLIIPSPGVPPLPEIKTAQAKGKKIMAEIELARDFIQGKIIGITGTNGKSTTTTLVHKILRADQRPSHLAGNIGTPLIRYALSSRPTDIYVTEISSFQLEYCEKFRCEIAVFLNFSANHLDWHGSLEAYWMAKSKLFLNLTENDVAILNRDDPRLSALSQKIRAPLYFFSRQTQVVPGIYVKDGWLYLHLNQPKPLLPLKSIKLVGEHNLENVMASLLVGYLLNVPLSIMRQTVSQFTGLEHRLEKVALWKGITFYNDSKATTVDATIKALNSLKPGIILIMGGRDKGADFSLLRPHLKNKVRQLILIGEAKEKIKQALDQIVPINEASTMREAVIMAVQVAKRGESILLSPACTSFDMFHDFEHRGRVFKQEIRKLIRAQSISKKK
ncbi:MAG: UDP-N-acetylmuramoyl-L-alanine--D-glutamate ligase [Candidatus Aminicenantes bacterium]|nr:UDP-N-acetylmuramoyl-L-alanine--D-glutamate ligase [Candidatus Aminicenantes bacterium]